MFTDTHMFLKLGESGHDYSESGCILTDNHWILTSSENELLEFSLEIKRWILNEELEQSLGIP